MTGNEMKTEDEASALLPPGESATVVDEDERYGASAFRVHKEIGFTWRRVLVLVLQIVPALPLAGWLLFWSPPPFGLPEGNHVRNALVFTWLSVVLLTYEVKILLSVIERQFTLVELFLLPVAFPVLIVWMCISTRRNESPIGAIDIVAGVLVVVGIILNAWPEVIRKRWKQCPENVGKLYTEGFFSYIRNPNYLGDLLWATGWALASNWIMMAFYPIITVFIFIFVYIPEKEAYLAKRYATEWPAYEAKTVKLFPFIY